MSPNSHFCSVLVEEKVAGSVRGTMKKASLAITVGTAIRVTVNW